ncbi:MAG: TlpA disulfide reductase family protein, partial [Chitinophagaceae bacterium]
ASSDLTMPFVATFGDKERFTGLSSPKADVNGRWAVTFTAKTGKTNFSVGEFVQKGARLTGTFLTPSGDYRFLEGNVSNDSMFLSGFDGGHAFLFSAKLVGDSLAGGRFYSGFLRAETWTARRDSSAKLGDVYSDTKLKTRQARLDFTFPDLDNNPVSISDPKYKGKVVLIQIMGSWCPNCMDETSFLSDYYDKNRYRGFEVIALAYETSTDFARSQKLLQPFRDRFNVKYPILITGVTATDSLLTEKTLPQLEKLGLFPTSIFVDRSGRVRKMFTGFSGPGTGKHFDEFKEEFETTIDELLGEKG